MLGMFHLAASGPGGALTGQRTEIGASETSGYGSQTSRGGDQRRKSKESPSTLTRLVLASPTIRAQNSFIEAKGLKRRSECVSLNRSMMIVSTILAAHHRARSFSKHLNYLVSFLCSDYI